MQRRRRVNRLYMTLGPMLASVLAILALGIAAAGATSPADRLEFVLAAPNPKPARQPARVLDGTGLVRWAPEYDRGSGYDRYDYVIVSRFDARKAARLPGTTLVYKSGTSIQQEWSTGVPYAQARANDWLLKDASGAHARNVQFGAFIADVGNPAYQRAFIENTTAFLKRTKVDGIFLDDVTGDLRSMTGGVFPAKYPDGAAWESAMVSFVHTVGKALKARGYYVLANAAKFVSDDGRSDTGVHVAEFWKRVAPGVSGLMNEYWVQSPADHAQLRVLGANWDQNWRGWQSLVSVAQASGVDFFGLTYGTAANTRAMRFARGSFLLDWHGRGGAVIYYKTDHPDPYHAKWVVQLGGPLGAKLERAPGIWQRRYERGIVVVNATSAATDVRVAGKRYTIAGADAVFVRPPGS